MKTTEEKLHGIALALTWPLAEEGQPVFDRAVEAMEQLSDAGKAGMLACIAEMIVSTDDRTAKEIIMEKAMQARTGRGLN